MNHGRMVTMATPFLIGIGLLLSACTAEPDYAGPAPAYDYAPYGSLDFDYGGDWGDWHRRRDHDDRFHGGGDHEHGGGRR